MIGCKGKSALVHKHTPLTELVMKLYLVLDVSVLVITYVNITQYNNSGRGRCGGDMGGISLKNIFYALNFSFIKLKEKNKLLVKLFIHLKCGVLCII